jgi:branched-chain amino acid transport system substrate-binding protein
MKMRRLLGAVVFVGLCLGLTSCGKKAGEIVIGEYGSLTGPTATFGKSTNKGIAMAVQQANETGGVAGATLRVITEDDQGRPEEAATAVNKLISQDQVIAVIGEVASSNSLAGAPICQKSGVPMISPSSTSVKVTEVGDYIFRVCFIDPFQGAVMAKFAAQSLRLTRVAILRDLRSDYSIGLADVFRSTFESLGGTISADESYQQGDVDFRAPLTALIASNPQAIFVPGYYTDVGLIARQSRDLGLAVPLLGGDGWDSPKLTEIGGKAIEGCYFSNHYATDDQNPVVQDFIANYKSKYNEVPDALAALGFDAARLLIHALKELQKSKPAEFASLQSGGATSGEAKESRLQALRSVRDLLAQTREFPGVTGSISLDEKRNALKPAVVLKIQDQKFSFVERIAP